MSKQDDVFFEYEGDNWFARNALALANEKKIEKDSVLNLLKNHLTNSPRKILEVGCSNGWRLNELHHRYSCSCTGIEPSEQAVASGKNLFPNINLLRGKASSLPFASHEFDLVIVSFVFHWISRDTLLQSFSEIDRVLRDDGLLVISDFLPDAPTKTKYHHLPNDDIFTFKQDYAKAFESTCLYSVFARQVFDHDMPENKLEIPSNRRGACTLLRKSLSRAYGEAILK